MKWVLMCLFICYYVSDMYIDFQEVILKTLMAKPRGKCTCFERHLGGI